MGSEPNRQSRMRSPLTMKGSEICPAISRSRSVLLSKVRTVQLPTSGTLLVIPAIYGVLRDDERPLPDPGAVSALYGGVAI